MTSLADNSTIKDELSHEACLSVNWVHMRSKNIKPSSYLLLSLARHKGTLQEKSIQKHPRAFTQQR
eukprot:4552116-Amphidinium_carterae.1